MIVVSHLTKTYGALKAVDDFSCTVGAGEIVGLIGPASDKAVMFGKDPRNTAYQQELASILPVQANFRPCATV